MLEPLAPMPVVLPVVPVIQVVPVVLDLVPVEVALVASSHTNAAEEARAVVASRWAKCRRMLLKAAKS